MVFVVTVDGKPILCEYSAVHKAQGVPATTTLDCRPHGVVPACARCADFFRKLNRS